MPKGPKETPIRRTVPMPPEDIKAVKLLAERWKVSESEVHRILHARGLMLEAALADGFTPQFKKGKQIVSWPDDRPKHAPFSSADLLRNLTKDNSKG